jgi:hypothetical protein
MDSYDKMGSTSNNFNSSGGAGTTNLLDLDGDSPLKSSISVTATGGVAGTVRILLCLNIICGSCIPTLSSLNRLFYFIISLVSQ